MVPLSLSPPESKAASNYITKRNKKENAMKFIMTVTLIGILGLAAIAQAANDEVPIVVIEMGKKGVCVFFV